MTDASNPRSAEPVTSMIAARIVIRGLIRAGVRFVVVAPGSRNAPLNYALAEAGQQDPGRITALVRIDERSAGFTALGLALASGHPVAVVTTSGTAVGNLMPAVMEADHAGVPLLVLSADRPAELRGTGANQTTDQVNLFGSHVRFAADLQAGSNPDVAVCKAVDAASGRLEGVPCGPVHLNIAFREPLTPHLAGTVSSEVDDAAARTVGVAVMDTATVPAPIIPSPGLGIVSAGLGPCCTVVLAGHGAGPEAEAFARALDLPLLAEPSSGARFGLQAVGPYRLLLKHFVDRIERLVVFGRPTLSRPVAALLARRDLPRALYLPCPASWFTPGRRSEQMIGSLPELARFAGRGPVGWAEDWRVAGRQATLVMDELLDAEAAAGRLSGLLLAREVWRRTPGMLMLGSSNPIRDVDLAASPGERAPRVFANRGLAGIDGTLSTASGLALGVAGPVRVLMGDLTLLHDAGGMLLPRGEAEPDVQAVVLNDGGGGIFSLLEHGALAEQPGYREPVERFFGTAHDADLAALATAYGWGHCSVRDATELASALDAPICGRSLLELPVRRSELRSLHQRLEAVVTQGLRAPG